MKKVVLFMMVSLDGYFEGPNHDLSWHVVDEEFNKFAVEQMKQIDTLLFGRATYQGFEEFWPRAEEDPAMSKEDLEIARMINYVDKIVFSRNLANVKEKVNWKNVRLVREAKAEEINGLKKQSGKDIAIFGSNELASSLLQIDLIDELRIMVNPIVLGNGVALFSGITERVKLKLLRTRIFRSGNVLHYYQPAKKTV